MNQLPQINNNTSRSVHVSIPRSHAAYEISIERGVLDRVGEMTAASGHSHVAIVSNQKVFGLYGDRVKKSLETAGRHVSVCLIGDGERYKNSKTLLTILEHLSAEKVGRTDAVIALGGGVVGDVAGFAASVHLRGIAFVQMPTTLLAMIDSSVGGKTGINSSYGKNLTGTIYQPAGVLIDVDVLQTLDPREFKAGIFEAVKQGAISGRGLFRKTTKFIDGLAEGKGREDFSDETLNSMEVLIAEQVKFKATIVKGDEREATAKTSIRSRKILNFGHTFAHALEKVTDYKYLKHGEAVGYGILFAASLSKSLELLPADELNLLNDVVHRVGGLPPLGNISPQEAILSLEHDKKIVGNSLHWVLMKGIGKPVIVPGEKIDKKLLLKTAERIIASS
ncbi:3-dehydroquinate synthase [soil metagenome]